MEMHDGVSKLWVVRASGGLGVAGFKDELEAVDHLIRCALMKSPDAKTAIEAAVAKALTHLDPEPRTCNRHDDCDAADAKARERGAFGADHCRDECCEDCFGS